MIPVSVLIPNLNGAAVLPKCLAALRDSSEVPAEVILIDNGSTDESVTLARTIIPTIRTITFAKNHGFGAAVNAGMTVATSEWVLVLNNDAIVDPNCIAELTKAAGRYERVASFSPRIISAGSAEVYATGLMYSHRGYGNRSHRARMANMTEDCDVFGFCGAVALLRKSAVCTLGGFNPKFFFLHEDVELSLRLRLVDYGSKYIPSAVANHIGSVTLRRFKNRAVRETIKNSVSTVFCCLPNWYWRRHWRHVFRFHVTLWRHCAAEGYAFQPLGALLWIVTHLPWLVRRRFQIQRQVAITPADFERLLYRGPVYINFPEKTVVIQ